MHGLLIDPVEWVVVYPVHVDPIGRIRRCRDGFHAKLAEQRLGVFRTGDAAVEEIWSGFLAQSRDRHHAAAVIHGSSDRHPVRGAVGPAGR